MQTNYFSGFKIMNPISLSSNFARILLLSTALVVSISTAIAGGRSGERNLMDDYLQSKTSVNSRVAPRLKTKALLLMSVDCCERAEKALEFTDVLLCK
jgi:hypothetical protein